MTGSLAVNTVLITGATGSIGGALATVYAAPGRVMILQGRDRSRLAELDALCTARGARVITQNLDLRHTAQLTAWLQALNEQEEIDLVITAAGLNTNIGPQGAGECWQEVQDLLAVNITASMATVEATLPGMRRRQSGQIALLSSLAAYYGLPVTPSYCASKAAIKAYGEALRGWLAPEGIRVNVIMPGYVASAMCNAMPGPKPFLWTAEQAACRIRRGLERDQPRITFPFPLNFGTWWLAVLPPALSTRIVRLLGYGG